MSHSIIEYFSHLPEQLHFALVPEHAKEGEMVYGMLSEHGSGSARKIEFDHMLLILIADFTPKSTFEKITNVEQEYLEISQFETESSSFKIGGRKMKHVERGICCYANTRKTTYTYCEAGKLTRFTKIILTKKYFDTYLKVRYGDSYDQSKNAMDYLLNNPNSPELNFVFQQIRDCQAVGKTQRLYLESKVMEILSLVTRNSEQERSRPHIPVKLDGRDLRALGKVVTLMKNDLAAYPSGSELAKAAGMSTARFQMAFRKAYGTTPYEYFKEMRLNYALLLLKDSDFNIGTVAAKVGYHNSGHFAKLFKDTYGMGPREYREVHQIK